MTELTREQIEAYRDSTSRLVTDFDREMAQAALAALDRAEAAEAQRDNLIAHTDRERERSISRGEELTRRAREIDRLAQALSQVTSRAEAAEAGWTLELEQRITIQRQRDELLARIFRDGGQKQNEFPTPEAACEAADVLVAEYIAEVARPNARAEAAERQRDAAQAEVARLSSYAAALVELAEGKVCPFCDSHLRSVHGGGHEPSCPLSDPSAAATTWREQVRRQFALHIIARTAMLDTGELRPIWPEELLALAAVGEEKPK